MSPGAKKAAILVDAGCTALGAPSEALDGRRPVPLIPGDGEYARAIARLRTSSVADPPLAQIPDEVYLHIYAGEILERIREWLGVAENGDGDLLVLPFWPRSLFDAAGLVTHAAREIEALFPPMPDGICVTRPDEVVAAECLRVLGEVRFEPRAYRHAVERRARDRRWRIIQAAD